MFFQHQASSIGSKLGPQPDDTSSLINKQFEMSNTRRLLWIWMRDSSQSLTGTARNLFGCFFCQRITKRELRKKSHTYMYARYENFFVTIYLVLLIYHAGANTLIFFFTNWYQNEFVRWRTFPVNIETTLIWFTFTVILLIIVLLPILISRSWKPLIAVKVKLRPNKLSSAPNSQNKNSNIYYSDVSRYVTYCH